MGHSKTLIAALVGLTLIPGCASLRWTVQKALREPGEALTAFPEAVWEEYDCGAQKLPFFIIEHNELIPRRVHSGADFNHRMVYVMCPEHPTEVVAGQLSTRIRFRGEPIVHLTDDLYEIKPGRWVVDASVLLPEDAEPGVYAFEVQFHGRDVDFEKHVTFVVDPP